MPLYPFTPTQSPQTSCGSDPGSRGCSGPAPSPQGTPLLPCPSVPLPYSSPRLRGTSRRGRWSPSACQTGAACCRRSRLCGPSCGWPHLQNQEKLQQLCSADQRRPEEPPRSTGCAGRVRCGPGTHPPAGAGAASPAPPPGPPSAWPARRALGLRAPLG